MEQEDKALIYPAFLLRYGVSLSALLLYVVFILLRLNAPHAYEVLLLYSDAMPNAYPFGDLGTILQAGTCWRNGVNVYVPSTCMHGGVYNYSPFLLHAAYLPIGPQDKIIGGLLLGAVFIAAVSLLPMPRSRVEFLLRIAAVCSGTVIYAIESANFDIVIFLLTLFGALMLLVNRLAALFGYAVFLFAAALKFYPAVLLGLVLRERLVHVLVVTGLVVVAGVVFMLLFAHGTAMAISILPAGLPFRCVFGAMNIPFGLVLLRYLPVLTLEPDVAQYFAAVDHPGAAIFVGLATRCLTLIALFVAIVTAPRYAQILQGLEPRRRLIFMSGAMVIVFCFFVAQNLDYRGVFMLFLLPGLSAMAEQSAGRRHLIVLQVSILLLLWEGFFRELTASFGMALLGPSHAVYPEIVFWLCRECLWWWVVIQLLAFIVCFVRASMDRLAAEAGTVVKSKISPA